MKVVNIMQYPRWLRFRKRKYDGKIRHCYVDRLNIPLHEVIRQKWGPWQRSRHRKKGNLQLIEHAKLIKRGIQTNKYENFSTFILIIIKSRLSLLLKLSIFRSCDFIIANFSRHAQSHCIPAINDNLIAYLLMKQK